MVKIMSRGAWVLGHTQQQGGSTLQAGARAEYIPSRVTLALSTLYGRMAARAMGTLDSSKALIHYATLRPFAINELFKRLLRTFDNPATVVDPAAGYSPLLIWMAQEFPQHNFVELDTETLILDKIHRFHHADVTIPQNLSLLAADLSVQRIKDVMYDDPIDIILANGTYVRTDDFRDLLHYLRTDVLSQQGAVVATFPYEPGIRNLLQQHWMFKRFAGVPRGIIPKVDVAVQTMRDAGYYQIQVFRLPQLANDLNRPIPNEVEIILTGRVQSL